MLHLQLLLQGANAPLSLFSVAEARLGMFGLSSNSSLYVGWVKARTGGIDGGTHTWMEGIAESIVNEWLHGGKHRNKMGREGKQKEA